MLCSLSSPHAAATARLTAIARTQLKEVQNTLELVQGQRNELRQEVKDLKAALADAKDTLEVGIWTAATLALRIWRAALKAEQRMLSGPVNLWCIGAAAPSAYFHAYAHSLVHALLATTHPTFCAYRLLARTARTHCLLRVTRQLSSSRQHRMQQQQLPHSWLRCRRQLKQRLSGWQARGRSWTSS